MAAHEYLKRHRSVARSLPEASRPWDGGHWRSHRHRRTPRSRLSPHRGEARSDRENRDLTTTSARDPSRTSQSSGSPTPSSSRFGTGTTSTTCRSRWPSPSACRVAASSTASPPARILARRRL